MPVATRSRTEVPINLLPPQLRSAQRARRMLGMAIAAAGVFVFVLVAVAVIQRMMISNAENTLKTEQTKAADLQTKVGALKEFDMLQASIDSNRQTLATALTNDVSWSRLLDDLDTATPGDSWLTGLTLSAKPGITPMDESSLGTVQFTGFVTTFNGLSGWLDTMSGLKGMRFVYLSQGRKQDLGGSKVVSFNASAHVTEALLSNRCQKEGSQCP